MKICKFKQCEKKVSGRNMCSTHYARWYRNGKPVTGLSKPLARDLICTVKSCENRQYSKSMCSKHYTRNRVHGDAETYLHKHICSVENCNKKHSGLGFCAKHYYRYKNNGSPYVIKEHGDAGRMKHRDYTRYRGMINRCRYKKAQNYKRYGGRGIDVCSEWLDKLTGFEAYAKHIKSLPNAHKTGYTIDRIDNNKGYSPDNVRWATAKQQQKNSRQYKKTKENK